ncbi:hypothetical protein Tco_1217849 [Tanacetum coccineum]
MDPTPHPMKSSCCAVRPRKKLDSGIQNMVISTTSLDVQIYTHLKAYEASCSQKTLKKQESCTTSSLLIHLAYVASTPTHLAPALSSPSTIVLQPTALSPNVALMAL